MVPTTDGLSTARIQLAEALQHDLRRTPAEAQFEVAATLRSVRDRAGETEYATVIRRDEANLKEGLILHGVGLVAVVADPTGKPIPTQ